MTAPDFSFIIPHKNTPDLLRKCLDSIPRRNDVEIIVVDDNSDPDKVDFEHFPGLDDPFVEVYLTKEGKGAGYARNVAMSYAKGHWVLFCDADDFYTEALPGFLDEFRDAEADVVLWRICSVDLETGQPSYRGSFVNEFHEEARTTGNADNALLVSTPWKGMYNLAFLRNNHIMFNESRWGNDVVFSTKVAVSSPRWKLSDCIVYCITSHSSFGLISNKSLAQSLVRFQQESESIRLARKKFHKNSNIHQWYFETWFAVYKFSKRTAIAKLPAAIYSDGFLFVKECCKALMQ